MSTSGSENPAETDLSRRDWILLPLLSLATIGILAGSTELIARQFYPVRGHEMWDCVKGKGSPHNGTQGIPNAVCWGSVNDTPLIEYRLNSCGHRAGMECGPKPPYTFRIVMLGSSTTLGAGVPVEKAFPALLPEELSRLTGQKVQVYNEGMFSEVPWVVAPHLNSVLTAKPDAILWILTAYDISEGSAILSGNTIPDAGVDADQAPNADPAPEADSGNQASMGRCLHTLFLTKPRAGEISDLRQSCLAMESPRLASLVLLRHFLYMNQSLYVRSYLKDDTRAGFLRSHPNVGWEEAMQRFEIDDAAMEAQARAGGVPLVAVLVPNRAQAAMISMGEWPAGYDPYKLDNELRAIITSHGGTYIDILPDFRGLPNPEQYYYVVDAHPNVRGSILLASMLAKELTSGAIPELKAAAQPHTAQEQGR
ncbi:MAG: hypothetical protein ABSC48_12865 [Terracidiphilus sp.]